MSGTTWSKFFWSDWETDPALRLCSLAAQGLWMRLLCIAAAHDPIGYVAVAGRGLSETDIARMTGVSESEAHALLGELDQNGVFSRDRKQRIYSRRLIKDAKASAEAKKNGKLGGNPNLRKGSDNPPPVNPQHKTRHKPHKPEARTKVGEPIDGSPNLSLGRDAHAERAKGSSSQRAWPGPADFREAVCAFKGPDYAASWLDHTGWQDVPERAIVCKVKFTADRLKADLRRLLKEHGISVRLEAAA
jgi:hypothetical protein